MDSLELRNRLHAFISSVDEASLRKIVSMLKSDFDIENELSSISKAQLKEVEKRRAEYVSGKAKVSSWTDVRKRIESKDDL